MDTYYEGGGFGEYSYYDLNDGEYVCYSGNCRMKMDCHLSDTSWTLLGVFKIDNVSEGDSWMEQLFKHEGVCVWGGDTFDFASNMREKLPKECKAIDKTGMYGQKLYLDMQPVQEGYIGLGLYTDEKCSVLYEGADVDVYDVSGISESNLEQFNKDLETWRICQPCIAYSVDQADNGYYCYDKAGYENCNQVRWDSITWNKWQIIFV